MTFNKTSFVELKNIATNDVNVLAEKGKAYGDSWRKRGGVGAFMMLARKWDRIEQQVGACQYDVFQACAADNHGTDNLLDDIADLRRYLLLVEEHVTAHAPEGGPTPAYVDQDPDTAPPRHRS